MKVLSWPWSWESHGEQAGNSQRAQCPLEKLPKPGREGVSLQKGSVTPLEHRYCFEQCLLRYLAHNGLLGGWANEQGNQMIPPWAGLPQAHLQLGHVIPLSTSLALVLVSLTTLWVTFDLGKEPLPCA